MYKTGTKRKFPTKKYQTPKKSMVLPYGKNIRYRKPVRRTKKAIQQINSIQYVNALGKADPVSTALDTQFYPVSAVTQGTAVDQCTGTTIYAKSLYFQCQVAINPSVAANNSADLFTANNNQGLENNQGLLAYAKAKNVRVVVLLDRAPNGTVPKFNDVYKTVATNAATVPNYRLPNVKNPTDPGAHGANPNAATPLVMLDPDKTRRFKILMNEIVTVSLNDPCVHLEKYIPLNFYITMSGNNTAVPEGTQLITNGVYCLAFTEPERVPTADVFNPAWAFTSKMRFEP